MCTLIYILNCKLVVRHLCCPIQPRSPLKCRRGQPRARRAHAAVLLHSREDYENQRMGEIKELLPPATAFVEISAPCLSPNKKSRSASFSLLPPCPYRGFDSQLFHICKPIFKPFLKASDRSANSYYCSSRGFCKDAC